MLKKIEKKKLVKLNFSFKNTNFILFLNVKFNFKIKNIFFLKKYLKESGLF